MNSNRKVVRNRPIPEQFANRVYLDPTYDPAFKAFFDSEDALKDFLDGVLGLDGDNRIKTLRFTFDKTVLFHVPQRSKVVFDIFATTGNGRFLNVEMQRLENDFFTDRVLLYMAYLVIKAKKELELSKEFLALTREQQEYRRYQLPETVSVWICDFDLPGSSGYRDEWVLYSESSLKSGNPVPVSKKNKYIFLSVPNFTKSADEVRNPADVWLYLLNHAREGGNLPNFGSGIVEEALERIRVENADDDLLTAQELNMTTREDYESWAAGLVIKARAKAVEEGRAEGRAEGHAEGHAEGLVEGGLNKARDMARTLKAMGISIEKITAASGLSYTEVDAL